MARRRRMLGEVQLLGLGAFTGGRLNPIYGTLIGGGTAAVSTIASRHAGLSHPELIGFGVGAGSAAVMFAMKSTRGAAVGALIGAFFASGIQLLEKHLMGSKPVAGFGYPMARNLNGLGYPQARALNGLGIPSMSAVPTPAGAVAGAQLGAAGGGSPPVSLLGAPSDAAVQLLGAGGPMIHGLSAAYGATLLGAGR